MIKVLILLPLFFVLGCQTAPKTVVKQKHSGSGYKALVGKSKKQIVLTKDTVVLDVRSQFDYQVARLPKSISMSWTDFVGKKDLRLKTKLRDQIRRLALRGVGVDTPIVVVGYGQKGQGEEGRLAWTLLHMGYTNVQMVSVDYFRKALSAKNEIEWEAEAVKTPAPSEVDSLYLDRADLEAKLATPHEKRKFVIIDVRTAKEFIKQSKKPNFQDFQAINISWKNFIDETGRPSARASKVLKPLKIDSKTIIYVMSDNGLRSGAVSAALYLMGYQYVANLDGGLINTKR